MPSLSPKDLQTELSFVFVPLLAGLNFPAKTGPSDLLSSLHLGCTNWVLPHFHGGRRLPRRPGQRALLLAIALRRFSFPLASLAVFQNTLTKPSTYPTAVQFAWPRDCMYTSRAVVHTLPTYLHVTYQLPQLARVFNNNPFSVLIIASGCETSSSVH